jgi:hypothetical protein
MTCALSTQLHVQLETAHTHTTAESYFACAYAGGDAATVCSHTSPTAGARPTRGPTAFQWRRLLRRRTSQSPLWVQSLRHQIPPHRESVSQCSREHTHALMQTCIPCCPAVRADRTVAVAGHTVDATCYTVAVAGHTVAVAGNPNDGRATLRCRWRMASGNAHVNIRSPKSRACCPRMLSACMSDRNERWRTFVHLCVLEQAGLLLCSSTRML